jgi:hypothetical protein
MIRRICVIRVLLIHPLLQTLVKDVGELKRVRFVMKGGEVVKNELPK